MARCWEGDVPGVESAAPAAVVVVVTIIGWG